MSTYKSTPVEPIAFAPITSIEQPLIEVIKWDTQFWDRSSRRFSFGSEPYLAWQQENPSFQEGGVDYNSTIAVWGPKGVALHLPKLASEFTSLIHTVQPFAAEEGNAFYAAVEAWFHLAKQTGASGMSELLCPWTYDKLTTFKDFYTSIIYMVADIETGVDTSAVEALKLKGICRYIDGATGQTEARKHKALISKLRAKRKKDINKGGENASYDSWTQWCSLMDKESVNFAAEHERTLASTMLELNEMKLELAELQKQAVIERAIVTRSRKQKLRKLNYKQWRDITPTVDEYIDSVLLENEGAVRDNCGQSPVVQPVVAPTPVVQGLPEVPVENPAWEAIAQQATVPTQPFIAPPIVPQYEQEEEIDTNWANMDSLMD